MNKHKKLVIAFHNPAKVERFKKLFLTEVEEVLTLVDLGVKDKAPEDGTTAEENAKNKALFYSKITNLPVFAQDAALYVDFLSQDKQPGVYVRRVNGKELTDDELYDYWDKLIVGTPTNKRTGSWHASYCFAIPGGRTSLFSIDQPRIFFSPPSSIKIPGRPLSSFNGPTKFGKPYTELTEEEKEELHQEVDKPLIEHLISFF
jgi:inosine/xanthosine triphosphate pyrophosphatase family protein